MKTISQNGLALIKRFEGCRLTAYDDLQPHLVLKPNTPIKGTLTIGWGHTATVYIGQIITQEEANNMLVKDLATYVASVNNPYFVAQTSKLNQNQFDALVSFCYNCGSGNLKNLCGQNRTFSDISEKILSYNKSKGQTLLGLTNRRKAEKKLFDTPMEDEKMSDNIINYFELKINDLYKTISKLNNDLTAQQDKLQLLQNQLKDIPAPQWILEEFPDVEENLSQKTGTYDFWRTYFLILKYGKYGK